MNALEIFDIFTRRGVNIHVSNMKPIGWDEAGNALFAPQVKVVIGKNGISLATFIGDTLEVELNNAYHWAIENKVVNDAPVYLAQCETCMRKIAGNVLDVCKDETNSFRHQNWHTTTNHDYCVYALSWDSYPESHWASVLTPEQFAHAKSLNKQQKKINK